MAIAPTAPREVLASVENGRTLPGSWYTDPHIHALEKERIFRRFWQYVAPRDRVATPGDFVTARLGDVPVIVTRDEHGELGGFVNVCCHRGSEVVTEACGNRRSLQCGYHAWTYGLDGRLRAAPRAAENPSFNIADHRLTPIRVAEWGPFVFVCLDPDGPELSEQLGELPGLIDATGLDISTVRYRDTIEYEIQSNWKIVVENFSECYHCPLTHPKLSGLLEIDEYRVLEYPYFSTHVAPIKETARQGEEVGDWTADWDVDTGARYGSFNYLWPNFMVNVYPGPGNVSTNIIIPLGPEKTLAVYEFFYADDVVESDANEIRELIDLVQREDVPLCESVQRGAASGYFTQGTLIESRENGVAHFQRLVASSLAAEHMD
ncbi:MAG: choline monooxygenase [Gaiellales bacterium]|nr:choline monooxygenase [Gaiellales bacterium]